MDAFENLSPYFTEIMETLLAGEAICEFRHPSLHRALHDRDRQDRAAAGLMLGVLGRRIQTTNDVFYAVYEGLDDTVEKRTVAVFTRYLKDSSTNMEFFDILRLVQGGKVLETGEIFSFGDVLRRINQDPALNDRLLRLANDISRLKDPTPEQALHRVFDHMEAYLHCVDTTAQQFVVTGEYTLFNEWFDFVFEHEGIDISQLENEPDEGSESAPHQETLL